jgi:galactokinase
MVAMTNSAGPGTPEWNDPWTRSEGEARARATFAALYLEEPTGIWSAPGRINFVGDHTDYNGGLCLPAIIRHRAYVAGRARSDGIVRIVDASHPKRVIQVEIDHISEEMCRDWLGAAAGVVNAMVERGYDGPGLDLAVASCVPQRVGLASTAAFACATSLAVNELWRLALDTPARRVDLAEAAYDAESLVVGESIGRLNEYVSLFGSRRNALLLDCSTSPPAMEEVVLGFREYGLEVIIVDTRTTYGVADAGVRRAECAEAASALGVRTLREVADAPNGLSRVEDLRDATLRKRARHVVSEIHRVRNVVERLAAVGPAHERLAEVGRLISASHDSLARDFEVSGPQLDLAVAAARGAGALGAKLVGVGFGGAVIALIRRTARTTLVNAVDLAFADAGFEPPRYLIPYELAGE